MMNDPEHVNMQEGTQNDKKTNTCYALPPLPFSCHSKVPFQMMILSSDSDAGVEVCGVEVCGVVVVVDAVVVIVIVVDGPPPPPAGAIETGP